MNEEQKLEKAIAVIKMITAERNRMRSVKQFYCTQLKLPPTRAFLFRSKTETEKQIDFYNSVCKRLWNYYSKIVQTLTPNII